MNAQSLVLRALRCLHESEHAPTWSRLLTVVPLDRPIVERAVAELDEGGLVDAGSLRLTLFGFATAHAPRLVAHERRRPLRKAARVA